MSKWIGYAVSANCGEPLGCYQGIISEADGTTLTLTKAFRNGFPYPKSQVTLNASDIKDLKIIEEKQEPSQQAHSTISICKASKKAQKATVCENLQANPSSSGNLIPNNKSSNGRGAGQGLGPSRSKPIDIQQQVQRNNKNNNNNNNPGSFGNPSSTPKARGGYDKARRRNEACFGDPIETYADDFDFEGNLALFDKQREWERMRSAAHKPDLVRQADDVGKYRHDENVLGTTSPAARRAIRIPDELRGPLDYVTDEGVVVPSATPRLRRQLWEGLQRYGLADCAGTLLARATADVSLRLVGGGRRLDPRNAHQTPTVVALVGPHRSGAVGICTARLLASHGVRTAVLVGGAASVAAACTPLQKELAAFTLGGTGAVSRLERLPSPDLVLLALYDLQVDDAQDEYSEILEWARCARAAIVAVEPPSSGWEGLNVRAAVVGGLPPTLSASLGRAYLADVAPPARLFSELRIAYRPPFGAAPVLALHPSDD